MSEFKIPESIHHSHQFQQMDLGENIYLFQGQGPGEPRSEVGEIYNFEQFPCLEDDQCEDFEAMAVAFADKVVRAYNCHDALLAALKEEHGWDDPLHVSAQPDCWKCAAITKAKGATA